MIKSVFYFAIIALFAGFNAGSAMAKPLNLLANEGFRQYRVGATMPVKGWRFQYNERAKGEFIENVSLMGKGPILKIVNPLKDKSVTLRSGDFEIVKPGKYRATIWIKTGVDTLSTSKNPTSATLRLIRADWKKQFAGKPQQIHDKWLKYEYEMCVSNDSPGRFFFRLDLSGFGTFYVADPFVTRVEETTDVKEVPKEPLKEIARFSFDDALTSDNGEIIPVTTKNAERVPGFKESGITTRDGGTLSYPIGNLLRAKSGAFAFWAYSNVDRPAKDEITLTGQNELGKNADIARAKGSCSFVFNSAYGRVHAGHRLFRYAKEWRHFIFAWDYRNGLNIYVDGRLFYASAAPPYNSAGDTSERLLNVKLDALSLFTPQKTRFDELRLFNRELTGDEALTLYEEYVSAYPVLLDYATIAGSEKPLRVKVFHKKHAPSTKLDALVESLDGEKLFEEKLNVTETGNYNINFHPSSPGDYRLAFLFNGKRVRTFEITAISPNSITESMPESISGDVKTRLIEEIDCAKDYPSSRYLDDGDVQVVNSPLGKYRESTRRAFDFYKNQGFVYNFTVKNPDKPHWLEIEYPDDKPRVFYVTLGDGLNTIGVANGVNNPVTGKLAKKRLLFWPDRSQNLVACFGYKTFPGNSGPAMKSIRIYEMIEPLPRLKVNTPKDAPQRVIGNWNEDPSMPASRWFKKGTELSFRDWRDKARRRIEYTRFMGENLIVLQVFDYQGDNNLNYSVLPMPASRHFFIPGWACLAATMFEREDLPFYIQFNDRGHGIPIMVGMENVSKNILDASKKGENALELITADGDLVANNGSVILNFLCPAVREAQLKRIRFYREQFGIYANFKGMTFFMSDTITFRNEKVGYGDYTIALFEKETGIKIPVYAKGLDRFNKRYVWLKSSDAWELWIDWRCGKVKEFLLELTRVLNNGNRKDLKIALPLKIGRTRTPFICENLKDYPATIDMVAGFKNMGIDITSLSAEPSLIIEPESGPNYGLLYPEKINGNYDAFLYSDDFARLLNANAFPALTLSRKANMEIYRSSPVIKKYWWPRGNKGKAGEFHCFSSALPDNLYLPQTLAWGLANGDLWRIDHGWWGNPENGGHDKFQKFYQAYRSIPAVKFEKSPGVNDPVMVRKYNNNDGSSDWFNPFTWFNSEAKDGWLYLVNTQYYKTKIKITFDSEIELTDAVFNVHQPLNGNTLNKELEPYQVACFRSDSPIDIVKIEQIVPENIIKESARIIANLKTGATLTSVSQAKALIETAEKMLEAKRYSALYYLSRSYSAQLLLKEAEKTVFFQVSLDPDSKSINIDAVNRIEAPVSVELNVNASPKELGSLDQKRKFTLQSKQRKSLNFPLPGLDLDKIKRQDELEFKIEYRLNNAKANVLNYTFRPVIATAAKHMKIDGDLSDWTDARWRELGECDNSVNVKGTKPLGPFESVYAVKWGEEGLYLAVKVKERDFLSAPNETLSWQYDFWEIMFDQRDDNNNIATSENTDNCHFRVSNIEGNSLPQKALNPSHGQIKSMVSQCQLEKSRNDHETIYEVFFPATVLNKATFKPGANIGCALKLHNREHNTPGDDLWGYAISASEYPLNKPHVWNDILLSKTVK